MKRSPSSWLKLSPKKYLTYCTYDIIFVMEDNKEIQQISSTGREWFEGSPNIELDQICFVRAIKDLNQMTIRELNGKNKILLTNVEDSSRGKFDVSTVHWSVNHKVNSHSSGEWFGPKMVVVAPAKSLIKENGNPENLHATDTFWSKEMCLPTGTRILSVGDNELVTKKIDGVKIIKSEVTSEELEKLKLLEKAFLAEVTNFQKESGFRSYGKRIEERINNEVNKIISDMGYSILDDSYATYMGNDNLDSAIADLANRLKVKNNTSHENTIYGQYSMLVGEKGFLDIIKNFKFEPVSEFDKETDFSELIDSINWIFSGQEIETKGQEDIQLRFSAQLYDAMVKYPKITNELVNMSALRKLFISQPFVLENIEKWSENDQRDGNIVKEKIRRIIQTEP